MRLLLAAHLLDEVESVLAGHLPDKGVGGADAPLDEEPEVGPGAGGLVGHEGLNQLLGEVVLVAEHVEGLDVGDALLGHIVLLCLTTCWGSRLWVPSVGTFLGIVSLP